MAWEISQWPKFAPMGFSQMRKYDSFIFKKKIFEPKFTQFIVYKILQNHSTSDSLLFLF